jgi:hypothetical protein
MPVETQIVGMPTYVRYNDLSFVYSGDKQHPADYDVTSCMHPFDGIQYTYVPEDNNWIPNPASAWEKVRTERNKKIESFRWKIDRQRDLIAMSFATAETLTPLLVYVQTLRDIPQVQPDPFNIVWPTEPAE